MGEHGALGNSSNAEAASVEADLICEALTREIANAGRWTAARQAWLAILTVRRMEGELREERAMDATEQKGMMLDG